jgi:hypothetical protein
MPMNISWMLLLCALGLSGTAAYYSIVGLAAIFASAFWPVVIMSGILEGSKLVVASWLYQNWNRIPLLIKTYLTSAVVVLMFITSLGIFGFLSKAHVEQALTGTDTTIKIEQIDSQIAAIKSTIQRYETQLTQLDKGINIQLDAKLATQAMAARKQQESERTIIRTKIDGEQGRLEQLVQQKTALKQQISVIESKVGPIRYVAEFFADGKQVDLDQAVRWMIVIIVLVFDPLAVLMLIAANMSFVKNKSIPDIVNNQNNTPLPPTNEEPVKQSETPVSPIYGQIRWDDAQQSLVYFTGYNWTKVPLPEKEVTPVPVPITTTEPQVVQPPEQIDYAAIKNIVVGAMDSWLTKTLNDPQAGVDDDKNNEPNSQIDQSDAVLEPNVNHNNDVINDDTLVEISIEAKPEVEPEVIPEPNPEPNTELDTKPQKKKSASVTGHAWL